MSPLKIFFCGGAGTVTGANFLLKKESPKSVSILVDCGLVQGGRFVSEENRKPFPYDPKSIDFLLVTHAHIDHIGRIPKLVKEGFRGEILSALPTRIIAKPMFYDAARIMETESRENGTIPLYEKRDIEAVFSLWRDLPYREKRSLAPEISVFGKDAGHVLGSVIYEIEFHPREGGKGGKIVFTGDLGNSPSPLLPDAEEVSDADYLIMESVYGDRDHEESLKRREILGRTIRETVSRGGTVLIPSFSLEKTQVILNEMNALLREKKIPETPVFLDSPLAIEITGIYGEMKEYFNDKARGEIERGDDIFSFPNLRLTERAEDSERIAGTAGPKIIIAGAGMSTGGRIIGHERNYLPDPKNTILFVGYQVAGSLGRQIEEGAKNVVIGGQKTAVRARIETIKGYSSHKDGSRLLEFVEKTASSLKKVFVVMGEPKSAIFLAQRIRDYLGVPASAPKNGERAEIIF